MSSVVNYTCYGLHDSVNDKGIPLTNQDDKSFARHVTQEGGASAFFIRLNVDGEPYTLENHTEYEPMMQRLTREYCFKEVKEDVFNLYTDYLKTNVKTYLKEVERRLI